MRLCCCEYCSRCWLFVCVVARGVRFAHLFLVLVHAAVVRADAYRVGALARVAYAMLPLVQYLFVFEIFRSLCDVCVLRCIWRRRCPVLDCHLGPVDGAAFALCCSSVEDRVADERRQYFGVDPPFGSAWPVSWVAAVCEVLLDASHCVVDLFPLLQLADAQDVELFAGLLRAW